MKIKEKIIRRAIKEAESEIKKIDGILDSNPLSDIISLRLDSIEAAKKMPAGSREVINYLNKQLKKEKTLFALAKKQENSIKLIERKAKILFELYDLKNELHLISLKGEHEN